MRSQLGVRGLLGEGINAWQVPPFLGTRLDAGSLLRAMPQSFPRCGELPVSAQSSMVAVGIAWPPEHMECG